MSNYATNVPLVNEPFVRPDGRVSEAWFMFLIQLYRRTGGSSGNAQDDVAVDLATLTDDSAISALSDALDATNVQLQTTPDVAIDKASKADLTAQSVALSLVLEEAQEVLVKLRRALQDSILDQVTPIDSIRSMGYQDASKVKIKGGSIDGVPIGATSPSTGAFTTVSASGQITSTVATGTAPFVIASPTVVPNLNASQLTGGTWDVPGAIGATTPNSAKFTTFSTTGNAGVGAGTAGTTFALNGSNSGSFGGCVMYWQNAGTPIIQIGNKSAIAGGAYDSTPCIYTSGTLTTNNAFVVATGFGCNGKPAQSSYSLGAAATDLASVITLANNLRTMAINNGMGA